MAKLTSGELKDVELVDLKHENAQLKKELKQKIAKDYDHNAAVMQLKQRINELQRKLFSQEIVSAEKAEEEMKQTRRDLLKSYAKKYKVKSEVWGYDPLTGDIIEDNEDDVPQDKDK